MKRLKQFILTVFLSVLAALFAALGVACKNFERNEYALNYTSLSLSINETQTLSVSPTVEDIEWTTSDESVATVEDGKVTAIGYGQASVRASFEDVVLTCEVVVSGSVSDGVLFAFENLEASDYILRIFEKETFVITPKLYVGSDVVGLSDENIEFFYDESIVKATVFDSSITLEGLQTGECTIYASYIYEGKRIYTDIYTLYVDVDKVLFFETESLRLLTPQTLLGENVASGTQGNVQPYVKSTMNNVEKGEVAAEELEWSSEDESVAIADNGIIRAVGAGTTTVKAATDYGTAEIKVEVNYPISSAEELDFLATVTYTQDEETARKYMSSNYVFVNDIDYSSHTRNYILPIASINHEFGRYKSQGGLLVQEEDYDHVIRNDVGEFALGGVTRGSYYSIGWQDVLSLEDTTKTVISGSSSYDARYMTNSSLAGYSENAVGTEFRGINPHGIAFSGTIDGNGYAIKNAFYMADNMQGQSRNTGVAAYLSTGYNGVGGFFVGYNVGTIKNLELHVSVANPRDYYYNQGKYSKTKANGSKKINELYLDEDSGNQKILLNSLGGVNTALVSYSPHKGREGTGATGIVAVNNGVLENLYHNVSVYASIAESEMAAQGVVAAINGYKIKNCVVNKFENSYQAGETTITIKTLSAKAGNVGENLLRYASVGEIKGSEISGCYSLSKRDCTHASAYASAPKALTFSADDYSGKFFGGVIDEISSQVFTDLLSGTAQDWNADYAGMYEAYRKNGNLDESLWNISYANGVMTIELKDNIKGLSA